MNICIYNDVKSALNFGFFVINEKYITIFIIFIYLLYSNFIAISLICFNILYENTALIYIKTTEN